MAKTFVSALKIWPTGTYALWYPIKDQPSLSGLHGPLAAAGLSEERLIKVELRVRASGDPKVLSGSGLVIANPPWTLGAELRAGLPEIADALAQAPGGGAAVTQLGAA